MGTDRAIFVGVVRSAPSELMGQVKAHNVISDPHLT